MVIGRAVLSIVGTDSEIVGSVVICEEILSVIVGTTRGSMDASFDNAVKVPISETVDGRFVEILLVDENTRVLTVP